MKLVDQILEGSPRRFSFGNLNIWTRAAHVENMVMGFAKAAGEAKRLGSDYIEIHGAHRYLISQFFWDKMKV